MNQRRLRTALGVFACALPALIYKPFLDNPFVFDDRVTVLLNPSLADLSDVRGVLLHNLARPAVNISYAVDQAFWGFSSFGFHLTNGLLHIIVVGLLYGWCTRALADGITRVRPKGATARRGPGSDRGQTRVRPGSDRGQTSVRPGSDRGHPSSPQGDFGGVRTAVEWPAFFAAAAFGVHPLMSATTAYVSARSELLAALGVLAALMFARRAIVRVHTASWVIAGAFSLLAAASSASAAALPLLALAYDAWVLGDKGWRGRTLRIYLPALVAIALLFVAWRLPGLFAADRVPARGVVDNLLTEAIVIWRYAGLLAGWPGQALVHQVHWVTTSLDPAGLIGFTSLAVTVAMAVHFRHSRPLVAFGVVWFVAVLAPSSSLVPLRDAMAEPRAYLASVGLFVAAASALAQPLASRRLVRAVALAAVVVLGIQTYHRNRLWSDPMKLWEEAVQRSPDAWQARLGYGDLLREIRRCDLAVRQYEAAVGLNPGEPEATAGLSTCR